MHKLIEILACVVATYAVNAVWQVPLIAGAGWLASRMLGRVGPRAQHRVWVGALLLSVGLPAVPVVRMLMVAWGGGRSGNGAGFSVVMGASGTNMAGSAAGVVLPEWSITAVFILYGLTVGVGAVRLLWLLRRTAVLVSESEPVVLEAEKEVVWGRCRSTLGVEEALLLASQGVPGVVTVGRRVLVPEGFAGACTESELLSGLGHECAHIRRRDSAKHLMYEAASVLTGFHPVTWMVKGQVAATREMVCDAMVVEGLVDRKRYTQSLLRLAERMLRAGAAPVHAIGIFDANVLEKRIMRIKAARGPMGMRARWALTVGAGLLLGTVAATGASMGTGVAARAADHSASDAGKIYKAGEGGTTNPRLVYAPDPEFPKGDRSKGGVCVVALVVDAQGMPQAVHVERSLKADFDANALAAVRQYRFKPGVRKGQAVAVAIKIEVNFRRY